MTILLRGIKLYEPEHDKHGKQVDILVKDGQVAQIKENIEHEPVDYIIKGESLSVSVGWADLKCSLNDPGYEYKEDFDSLCKAAAEGGFTDVAVLPNTYPIVDTVQAVNYIKQNAVQHTVNLHPIAAFTKKTNGTELSEMIDLHNAGVGMFSDGSAKVEINAVFGRALRYLQPFHGLLMCYPEDADLLSNGQMHEGKVSTLLGMKGMPAIAEEVAVMKALKLLEYYGGKLHFSTISTAGSVKLIKEAKQQGLQVTCDIAAYQICFTDDALHSFDTYLKVKPPFRTIADKEALIIGLQDGTIDALVSNHSPQDTESKQLEFDLADFGIISLETAYAAVNSLQPKALDNELLVDKLSKAPRRLSGLATQSIKEGLPACLTIFHENLEWTCLKEAFVSKAGNSPFIGEKLKGKALGIINGEKYHFSDLLKVQFLEK